MITAEACLAELAQDLKDKACHALLERCSEIPACQAWGLVLSPAESDCMACSPCASVAYA